MAFIFSAGVWVLSVMGGAIAQVRRLASFDTALARLLTMTNLYVMVSSGRRPRVEPRTA
jgi:hypothetical protein